jgi:hypothetical protein
MGSNYNFASQVLGRRAAKSAAALPQTAQGVLFNITGGRVLLTMLLGEVTTAIQAQATLTKVVANPTVGADVDLSATVDLTGKAVGTLIGVTGTAANALVAANAVLLGQLAAPAVLPIGSLDLNTAASSTGAIKWIVYYVPLDPFAKMAAA